MTKPSDESNGKKIDVKDRAGKYLTFVLADEEYGIDILRVREIIGMMPTTSIPQTPDYVNGVINLRGNLIVVIDLRKRFGMETVECTERTCIIVVEIAGETDPIIVGVIVDSVSEVVNIQAEELDSTPSFGANLKTDYILGMARAGDGVKILIDIDKVWSSEELSLLSSAA